MADFSRLPGPNADLWDWQLHAACRGVDSSLFFHPEGERGAARSARENSAKEVCMRCPVRAECAAHALAVREPYGVWGGLTEDEREELMGRARHRLVSVPDRGGRGEDAHAAHSSHNTHGLNGAHGGHRAESAHGVNGTHHGDGGADRTHEPDALDSYAGLDGLDDYNGFDGADRFDSTSRFDSADRFDE
jgi:WhiB family redox-sensing transcriptional regulator